MFLDFVSELMLKWTQGEERPESGSLVSLVTQEGITSTQPNKQ